MPLYYARGNQKHFQHHCLLVSGWGRSFTTPSFKFDADAAMSVQSPPVVYGRLALSIIPHKETAAFAFFEISIHSIQEQLNVKCTCKLRLYG